MTTPQTIAVTGASGLVGRALVAKLQSSGRKVIQAGRRPVRDEAREMHWDPELGEIDSDRLATVDAVVHLAGENVAGGRWTDARKQKIHHSRTKGTLLVSQAIADLQQKPPTLVAASAIGYYGSRGDEVMTETSSAGDDFLAEVCQQWEASCSAARDAGVRVVNLRIGVVLSSEGGALKSMLTPFKLGMGGVLGSGRQYMSWIARSDLVRCIEFALDAANLSGPVTAVAPQPVTNKEFTKTLGAVLKRPTFIPMPATAARLLFGEMADALLLSSTRVVPAVLTQAGFSFEYPDLEPALRHVLAQ